MSLRSHLSYLAESISTRLALGYGTLLFLSLVLLYVLSYWQLTKSLSARDREAVHVKLAEYEKDYRANGFAALVESIQSPRGSTRHATYVRIVRGDSTLLTAGGWPVGALKKLSALHHLSSREWDTVHFEDDGELQYSTVQLSNDLWIQIGISIEQLEESLEVFEETFIVTAFIVLLLGLGATMLLANRAMRPLRELTSIAGEIGRTGNIHTRIPERSSRDEFAYLGRQFNKMLARIDALVTGMRDTLDNVAHDLRTPMTRLRTRAELALGAGEVTTEGLRNTLEENIVDAEDVLAILTTILEEADAEAGTLILQPSTVSLGDIAREVVDLYQYVADEKSLDVAVKSEEVFVEVDRRRMFQVVANLLDNAIKYTENRGSVRIHVFRDGDLAIMEVQDSGIGIDEKDIPNVWNRLYRGDRSRSTPGLGLGLSLVRAIIEAHGGTVEVVRPETGGSIFSVQLTLSATHKSSL